MTDGFLPFDGPVERARARGHSAAQAASSRAARLDPGWRADALAAVERHCRTHARFMAEHVAMVVPAGADPRSKGHIVREAARLGFCVADGFAPTVSSRGSPKVEWRSLIYGGSK